VRLYLAPAAALLAVTAAVLGIHYGVQQHAKAAPAPVVHFPSKVVHKKKHPAVFARTYIVQRGDSFSTIAVKTHTSIARLEQLNPGLSPTALRVGQQITVK
jgi:LysM repeat protein